MRWSRVRRVVLTLPEEAVRIDEVNQGFDPVVDQNIVNISGEFFGIEQGTATYNGHPLTVSSWDDRAIVLDWPDLPYDSTFSDTGINQDYTLEITKANGKTATRVVTTIKQASAFYKQITSLNGIFANDVGVSIGDYFYLVDVIWSITDITTDGFPQGIVDRGTQPDWRGKYATWDGASWSNTATVDVNA